MPTETEDRIFNSYGNLQFADLLDRELKRLLKLYAKPSSASRQASFLCKEGEEEEMWACGVLGGSRPKQRFSSFENKNFSLRSGEEHRIPLCWN